MKRGRSSTPRRSSAWQSCRQRVRRTAAITHAHTAATATTTAAAAAAAHLNLPPLSSLMPVGTSYCPGPGSLAAVYIFHSTSLFGLAVLRSQASHTTTDVNCRRCSRHRSPELAPPPRAVRICVISSGAGYLRGAQPMGSVTHVHAAAAFTFDSHCPFHVAFGLGSAELAPAGAKLIVRHATRCAA